LGLVAAATNHLWPAVGQISLGIALYFGLYVFGIYLRSTMKAPAWTPTAPAAPAPPGPEAS
jgi:ABC-type branched-subunit amino acid transport system permease subunit